MSSFGKTCSDPSSRSQGKVITSEQYQIRKGKKIPENISKISTGPKHYKSQKSSAYKLLSQFGYRARTPQVLWQDSDGGACNTPTRDLSKPGGLSNHSLDHLSFPKVWDANLPWTVLAPSHAPQN